MGAGTTFRGVVCDAAVGNSVRLAPIARAGRGGQEQVPLGLSLLREARLVFEQPALPWQAAPVARETLVRADDAMAGDDDGDGVLIVREPHGAGGLGLADRLGDLPV